MTGLRNPRPLVLCGPSGSGKSTLLKKMLEDFPDSFGFSISHTTRKPREGEEDGKHYYFTKFDAMKESIEKGNFIESAEFCGNLYGTSKAAVQLIRSQGKVCVLDIDVQGVKQVKQTDLNPWYVFIQPPSVEVLADRLRARKTETPESLAGRLQKASDELEYGKAPGNFDVIIVNDDVEMAYAQLKLFLVQNVLK